MTLDVEKTLSEKQLQYIGVIAIESAFLDHAVEHMLWAASGMHPRTGRFFTVGMQLDRKLDLLREALKGCKFPSKKIRKGLIAFIPKAKDANSKRNTVVHGLWFPTKLAQRLQTGRRINSKQIAGEATAIRAPKNPDSGEHGYLSAHKLKDIAEEMQRVHHRFINFWIRHMEPRVTWMRKSRGRSRLKK